MIESVLFSLGGGALGFMFGFFRRSGILYRQVIRGSDGFLAFGPVEFSRSMVEMANAADPNTFFLQIEAKSSPVHKNQDWSNLYRYKGPQHVVSVNSSQSHCCIAAGGNQNYSRLRDALDKALTRVENEDITASHALTLELL